MRRVSFTIGLSILCALPAMAQQRPRLFDNFDAGRGVQVIRQERPAPVATAVNNNTKAKTPTKFTANTVDKKLLAKTAQITPKKPLFDPRTIRMSASEGLANTEMANYAASKTDARFSGASLASMKGFTTGSTEIDSYIVDSSRRYGIDPLLIYSQMHQESSFKLKALSPKGASGLMQLMPATARRLGVTNIYDPRQNIDGGVKYMRMLLDMFGGDVNLALAGYNAGEGAVMKYGNQIPPYNETREYVRRIGSRYASISDGSFARNYRRVNPMTAAKLEQKESRPLSVYEPSAVAIRLADGRMRLVNQ